MANGPDQRDGETAVQREPLGYAQGAARRRARISWNDPPAPNTTTPGAARAMTLERRVVVGSAGSVDVVLADQAVSRLHAELDPSDDGLWVRDLGSRNGTFVEGVRVTAALVPEGGRIQLGSTVLVVRYARAPTPMDLHPDARFGPLLGGSVAMRELFARLARVAPTESTVLITGETGTGKELVARAIHEASSRAQGPFAVVDCAALPEHLLEAELFGHARGAFTGATHARPGVFEAGDGGTVFLDEVGELPLAMQPKLLRVLESRTVRRLGETTYRDANVRVVSATHRDLPTMVNAGAFREDLYFRLAVLPIRVPPLRERVEDIPLLVSHFMPAGGAGALDPALVRELASRPWLGNVRELRNFVERALALGTHEALAMAGPAASAPSAASEAPLPDPPVDQPFKVVRDRWLEHLEYAYLNKLLAKHGRNVSAVAEAAGLARGYVHRLIKKHGL